MSSSEEKGQLHGWKEIAAYVGKGVRQAQRWEKQGMPVHRVQGMDGVVYAFRHEIDEWRRRSPQPDAVSDVELSDDEGRERSAIPRSSHPTSPGSWVIVAVFLGVTSLLVWGLPRSAVVTAIDRVKVDGTRLVALDAAGRTAWKFDLGFSATLDLGEGRDQPALLQDLDGDGRQEVIVSVRNGKSSRELLRSDRLFCFSHDGFLRWSYALDQIDQVFEGRRFPGPTRILAVTADERGYVWAAVNHHTWWPTVVVRIDMRGRGEARYVQSGGIYALRAWQANGQSLLLAGGVLNEYGLASLAIIDRDGPLTVSPQTAGNGYFCDTCPRQSPKGLLLLHRSDVSAASQVDPYSRVVGLEPVARSVRVTTWEGDGGALYHLLEPDLSLLTEPPSDAFGQMHSRLEQAGDLDHPFGECPIRGMKQPRFVWREGSGWVGSPPPVTSRHLPTSAQ